MDYFCCNKCNHKIFIADEYMPRDGLTVVEKTTWNELTSLEKILRVNWGRRRSEAETKAIESALNSMEFFSRNSCPKCGYKPDKNKIGGIIFCLFVLFVIFLVFIGIPHSGPKINSVVREKETSSESDQGLKSGPKTNSVVREKETSSESDQGLKSGSEQFRWYHELIHDRFFSQWEQPTSIFEQNKTLVCTVKIRILNDGTISSADIVHSSGNPIMDTSVLAALQRVTSIAPLPGGLVARDGYTVKINFELQ